MHGTTLQEYARGRADELPGARLEHPFGPDWQLYKVRDKVFMLMTDVTTPGYHMNKQHWITLRPGGSIRKPLVDELVTESYLLVVENLPRAKRPVDPATYGRRHE